MAVVEDLLQLLPHHQGMNHMAQQAKGQAVMHEVRHLHAALYGFKMVLVVPQAVRSLALLIHEHPEWFHMRDLRHPGQGNAEKRAHRIAHYLPGIDFFAEDLLRDPELQRRRRNERQLRRIGEKSPGSFHRSRDLLDIFQAVYLAHCHANKCRPRKVVLHAKMQSRTGPAAGSWRLVSSRLRYSLSNTHGSKLTRDCFF